jgi:PAS domain S-box-containing protein
MSIRKRLLLLLLVVLVPVLVVQTAIFYDRYHSRRTLALQANLEVARMAAQLFGVFTNDIFRKELALGIALTSLPDTDPERIQDILSINKEDYPAILEFTWVSHMGEVIASTRSQMIGQNVVERAFFREILSGKEKVISDLIQSKATGDPIFTLSRSIRDRDGTLLGVMVAAIEPERLNETFAIKRAETGTITLIDRQERLVYRYPKAVLSWEERNWRDRYPSIEKAVEGREVAAVLFSPIEKKNRMVALSPVGSTGWVAGAGVSEEAAMGPVLTRLKYDLCLLALVALAAFLAAVALSRRITSPIRRLRDQSLLLGKGELLQGVDISGPPELKDLADEFNAMAEKVRSRERALLETQSELERKVHERTVDLTRANEALSAEIIERRQAEVELKYYSERLKETNLELSHTLEELRTANEELQQQNEELIVARGEVAVEQERYRDLFENAPDGYLVTDMEGVIGEVNLAATVLMGTHRGFLKEKPLPLFVAEDDRAAFRIKLASLNHNRKSGTLHNWEASLKPYRGDVFPSAISISVVRHPHLDSTTLRWLIRDISDRKQAEDALKKSEARFRALFEQAAVGVAEIDTVTGRFMRVNQRYADIVGTTIEELQNTTFQAITHPEDLQADLDNMALLTAGKIREFEMEKRYLRGDGTVTWVTLAVSPLWDPGEPPARHIAVVNDISERKRAEAALEHKIFALTQPTVELGQLKLTDIVGVSVLQKLQAGFSDFFGIPSLIWDREGSPITEASNFSPFCQIVRSSPQGLRKCESSDRRVGEIALRGTTVIRDGCVMEGIMRVAVPLVIQGHHLATWGMGQVVERELDESRIRLYAREIEVDEEELVQASRAFSWIPKEKIEAAVKLLSIIAEQVALLGCQNLQQARLIHERKEGEKALRDSAKELRFLSSRLLTSQEEERKRIAGELHDGLAGSLSAIKISLENARRNLDQSEPGAELLDVPIAWTQHLIDEARRLMTELRPSLLDDMGLIATAAWFFRQYRTTYPEIHVEEEIRIEEEDIPEPLRIVIFRITQEAFHNIAKYSKAEYSGFSLVKRNDTIELSIQDNGVGFDLEAVVSRMNEMRGLGLASMKERTELSGGSFAIRSVLGAGTRVRATWPLSTARSSSMDFGSNATYLSSAKSG